MYFSTKQISQCILEVTVQSRLYCEVGGIAQNTDRISFHCSFLATGDSYQTLANRFRVGVSKVHEIIHEVCDAIWDVLQPPEMAPPTEKDWQRIDKEFMSSGTFLTVWAWLMENMLS